MYKKTIDFAMFLLVNLNYELKGGLMNNVSKLAIILLLASVAASHGKFMTIRNIGQVEFNIIGTKEVDGKDQDSSPSYVKINEEIFILGDYRILTIQCMPADRYRQPFVRATVPGRDGKSYEIECIREQKADLRVNGERPETIKIS
jgi:hypothetical protein